MNPEKLENIFSAYNLALRMSLAHICRKDLFAFDKQVELKVSQKKTLIMA